MTENNSKIKLSVCIICKNEEKIIARTLAAAAQVADEIIVVDSGSSDATLAIAESFNACIFHQDWLGYGEQKNIAISKCSHEWILSLDADEVLSDALLAEILTLKNQSKLNSPFGYLIARKLFIGSQYICWGGYFPDYHLRLVPKAYARFCNSEVHESIEILDQASYSKDRSKCIKLKNPILHYSYENLEQMEKAFIKFAEIYRKQNGTKSLIYSLFKSIYTFIYKFFMRLGFLHGILGFRLALIHSIYTFKKYF